MQKLKQNLQRCVLCLLEDQSDSRQEQEAGWLQACAIWHNMREEPVIYINGAPFVLREDERPFKNLQVGPHGVVEDPCRWPCCQCRH